MTVILIFLNLHTAVAPCNHDFWTSNLREEACGKVRGHDSNKHEGQKPSAEGRLSVANEDICPILDGQKWDIVNEYFSIAPRIRYHYGLTNSQSPVTLYLLAIVRRYQRLLSSVPPLLVVSTSSSSSGLQYARTRSRFWVYKEMPDMIQSMRSLAMLAGTTGAQMSTLTSSRFQPSR